MPRLRLLLCRLPSIFVVCFFFLRLAHFNERGQLQFPWKTVQVQIATRRQVSRVLSRFVLGATTRK